MVLVSKLQVRKIEQIAKCQHMNISYISNEAYFNKVLLILPHIHEITTLYIFNLYNLMCYISGKLEKIRKPYYLNLTVYTSSSLFPNSYSLPWDPEKNCHYMVGITSEKRHICHDTDNIYTLHSKINYI